VRLYSVNGRSNAAGQRVKQAREMASLSQEQLAARLQVEGMEVNQRSISRIESGQRPIVDYELQILSKVLDVDVLWLLEENNPHEADKE